MKTQKTILCIEDEEDLRIDLAEELATANYHVLQASNGTEALALLEKHRPDLVLCDITMPGLGGYGVLKAMREQGGLADVPFIFLTALAGRNDVLVGKQAGADDYLVKPIDYEILLASIEARLNQVERVKSGAVQRAEEAWQAILQSSRGRTVEALYKATFAFDRFLVGVAIVDEKGAVRLMNKEAERILAEDDGLGVSQGILKGSVPKLNTKLYDSIAKAFEEEVLDEIVSYPRLSGGRPYLVLVPGQRFSQEERPEAVVLLLIDTEQRTKVSGDTLVRLYNLTPSETRVALMLIDGKRLDQIAEELEVAQTTVVFHLKNLFRKTETNRQADLIRVLLSVPLRSAD
ncbi:helix-turn-helix transcriptional regulator [Microvirga terricola]|uniref:Response regulator transcription factor n=1 Tax=Microvirga terricola TaxID=2719797 RepID=A0ABX0VEM8_9HYPH|nr:response regulator [Microvirga terricola]NIX77616.1 response regulator transcription factor [Microvirga terricola]